MPDELVHLPPPDPFHLLQTALDKGMDADKLGRLVDLVEQWKAARADEAYNLAMNQCQAEMPAVTKTSYNPQTRSNYAALEEVNTIAKPVYCRHGFAVSFSEGEARIPEEVRTVADVMHTGGARRQYWVDLPKDGTGIKGNQMMTGVHGKASTYSYSERYLLRRIFNITVAGEDQDGNAGPTALTDAQVVTLNDLFEKIRERVTDQAKWEKWLKSFWSWLKCADMNDLDPKKFEQARLELIRVAAEKKPKEPTK